jgi:hypothetical protein
VLYKDGKNYAIPPIVGHANKTCRWSLGKIKNLLPNPDEHTDDRIYPACFFSGLTI